MVAIKMKTSNFENNQQNWQLWYCTTEDEKNAKLFSGLSPRGLKGQWYENGKRKAERKRWLDKWKWIQLQMRWVWGHIKQRPRSYLEKKNGKVCI